MTSPIDIKLNLLYVVSVIHSSHYLAPAPVEKGQKYCINNTNIRKSSSFLPHLSSAVEKLNFLTYVRNLFFHVELICVTDALSM